VSHPSGRGSRGFRRRARGPSERDHRLVVAAQARERRPLDEIRDRVVGRAAAAAAASSRPSGRRRPRRPSFGPQERLPEPERDARVGGSGLRGLARHGRRLVVLLLLLEEASRANRESAFARSGAKAQAPRVASGDASSLFPAPRAISDGVGCGGRRGRRHRRGCAAGRWPASRRETARGGGKDRTGHERHGASWFRSRLRIARTATECAAADRRFPSLQLAARGRRAEPLRPADGDVDARRGEEAPERVDGLPRGRERRAATRRLVERDEVHLRRDALHEAGERARLPGESFTPAIRTTSKVIRRPGSSGTPRAPRRAPRPATAR